MRIENVTLFFSHPFNVDIIGALLMFNSSSSLKMTSVTILGQFVLIGWAELKDSLTGNNASSPVGGVVYLVRAREAYFNYVGFVDNVHSLDAGGIFVGKMEHEAIIDFTDCLFQNNSAQRYGGAIVFESVRGVTLKKCRFFQNSAARGGALFSYDTQSTLHEQECLYENNIATIHGPDRASLIAFLLPDIQSPTLYYSSVKTFLNFSGSLVDIYQQTFRDVPGTLSLLLDISVINSTHAFNHTIVTSFAVTNSTVSFFNVVTPNKPGYYNLSVWGVGQAPIKQLLMTKLVVVTPCLASPSIFLISGLERDTCYESKGAWCSFFIFETDIRK
jgi:predicted outer membrane repeat protein